MGAGPPRLEAGVRRRGLDQDTGSVDLRRILRIKADPATGLEHTEDLAQRLGLVRNQWNTLLR